MSEEVDYEVKYEELLKQYVTLLDSLASLGLDLQINAKVFKEKIPK